jgi:DNA mismatch repair protein MutH
VVESLTTWSAVSHLSWAESRMLAWEDVYKQKTYPNDILEVSVGAAVNSWLAIEWHVGAELKEVAKRCGSTSLLGVPLNTVFVALSHAREEHL